MADGKELKPKSFRIDNATADRIKEIAADIGGNQQEVMSKLIEAYEFQSGKAILTDKKDDIAQFEKHITAITRMFMAVLEDNQNITATVRTEFDALLKSKDSTILELQEKVRIAKQLQQEAAEKAKTYADTNTELSKELKKLQAESDSKITDLTTMLADKEKLNQALVDSCDDLKKRIESIQEEHSAFSSLQKNYSDLKKNHDALKKDYDDANAAIEKLKEHETLALERCKEQMQIEQDKALLDANIQHQELIQKLKAENQAEIDKYQKRKEEQQAEIDKYQKKYFDLWEQLQNKQGMIGNSNL